ncbi:MAG: potassium transporter Kup [Elusimicrobia bacterium CG1_02_63_36]|nr:MAG: potassium transporter Kup [Elusimicrobia bacterium CG1_02_63_36]PIP82330.1 MAG: potassium transporter Kup [Elusimicrobia bacterium CG22_combo_CG10-13_8_21_14_all_63_91]PJB24966.1 MAG: potassium transporter Kup [Elusimicrobia bacterium CG_4_9_14_3_um_filter_62_55]
MSGDPSSTAPPTGKRLAWLSLGALGVVYGDIGTSPLYAIRECFHGPHGMATTPGNILGVLSLIIWSLILIVSFKYLVVVLRADNQGEGGILALSVLLLPAKERLLQPAGKMVALLGLFGAVLLYGDGMITPAISVLSAVEGLVFAAPNLKSHTISITLSILAGLFLLQARGTAGIGRLFGPITMLWFTTLGALGAVHLAAAPEVLAAFSPVYGFRFFAAHGLAGSVVLGSVFLVVTGGEALYADLGHFGPRPIRLAWFVLVLPGLLLNYLGQGALLLRRPEAAANVFFEMAPSWGLYPLIALSTAATIIASQAVISGVFSLTMQAVQLGYLPHLQIRHTSPDKAGQIYIPSANWGLLICTAGLVIGFQSSSALAAAYGLAVALTMLITTVLLFITMRRLWRWPDPVVFPLVGFFLIVDLCFFLPMIKKIPAGGWFPLVVAGLLLLLMDTWRRGRHLLSEAVDARLPSVEAFLRQITMHPPHRPRGTAVYMARDAHALPPALIRNYRANESVHEQVLLVTVETSRFPRVPSRERLKIEKIQEHFYRITIACGFMETPDVPKELARISEADNGITIDPHTTLYVLGRETVLATDKPGMALWRERLFARIARNAQRAMGYFHLPPNRVLEIGAQLEI